MIKSCSTTTTSFGQSRLDVPNLNDTGMPSPNIRERCTGFVFAALLRVLASTWRVDCQGLQILDELALAQHPHILAFWHRHYITLFRLFQKRTMVTVTNQSHRGQVIANICQRNGMRTLQVKEKGSKQALASLESAATHGLGLAIAVDGPLGPAGEVKPTVLHLATRLECPVVPISIAAQRKHIMAKRWDGLEIPQLFTRICFVIGTPISAAHVSSSTEFRELALHVENSINDGTAVARQRLSTRSISTKCS